jgi:hypothetical protein
MSKSRPQYLVSNDSIGFFGTSAQFLELWQEYFNDKTLNGVEVIAFKPLNQLNKLISTLKKNKIPVLSFHGKTGGENQLNIFLKIIMTVVNKFIFDAEFIFKNFPEIEFLSHGPYFEKNSIKKIVLKYRPKIIWIENHRSDRQGVEEVIKEIVFFRKNKINALGILDIFHYVAYSLKTLERDWSNIINELQDYFLLKDGQGKQIFTGIHFPIGTRWDDSLPIDDMSDNMLKLFAEKIIPLVKRVVFENQQLPPAIIFSSQKNLAKQKKRNKRIIERLKKTGIIL